MKLRLIGAGVNVLALSCALSISADAADHCYTAPNKVELCPKVPVQIVGNGKTLDAVQEEFDVFSWQSFVGLNWPVGRGTQPDTSTIIGKSGDAMGTWETFKNINSIFLANGQAPSAWDAPNVIPEVCKDLGENLPVMSNISKAPLVSPFLQPFKQGPIVDQAGNYSRFQINVNKRLFEEVVDWGLYSQAGQKAWAKEHDSINFSCSEPKGAGAYDGEEGVITLKSSWKIIEKQDDPARFHKADALIYTPATSDGGTKIPESCVKKTIGLVGFHIAQKVKNTPQWVWSTFEQVDNVPDYEDVKNGNDAGTFNYYKKDCKDCTELNELPPHPWIATEKNTPNQVARMIPIAEQTKALNSKWQEALRSVNAASVWQHYELISTQWPTEIGKDCNTPANASRPFGTPAPVFLANTTLETYIQGTVPRVSSSCLECHADATDTQGTRSDFTYILTLAQ